MPDRPHRPLGLRLANTVAALPFLARRLTLDVDELLATARRQTGLDDFGADTGWSDGLRALVGSLDSQARLTRAGRFFARSQVLTALTNRLRIEAEIAGDPSVLDRPIDRPLVVVGLPRTGTTLLQTLLALDPDNRSLRHWEAASPSPAPTPDGPQPDPRIASTARAIKLVDYLSPDARRLHPVGAERPTECVTLFTNSFASLELTVINWVPDYLKWCLTTDMAPHYAYYRRQLQLLQRHDRGLRWSLKSPAHLFWVDELVGVFPDVCLVQTHRDPVDVMASYCNLVAVLTGIGSDDVDLPSIGPLWTSAWASALERADDARRRTGVPVVDVHYRDLVNDPVRVVTGIYDAFGLPMSARFEQRLRDYVAHDTYTSGRTPGSRLEDYGISESEARQAFASYCAAHGVGAE